MNSGELILRLYKEKKDWRSSETQSNEINWVVRGLDICLAHVRDMIAKQFAGERIPYAYLTRTDAGYFYQTIRTAHRLLRNGNRARAVRVLEKALERKIKGGHNEPSKRIGATGSRDDRGGHSKSEMPGL